MGEEGPAILADVARIKQESGSLTVRDICALALRHKLNLKAIFDFLEDSRVLPCGTYDRCKEGGIKPMAALRETWEEMQGGKPDLPALTEAEQEALDKLKGDGWTVEYSPRMDRWTLKRGVWATSPHPTMGEALTAAETLQAGARATLERKAGECAGLKRYLESGQ